MNLKILYAVCAFIQTGSVVVEAMVLKNNHSNTKNYGQHLSLSQSLSSNVSENDSKFYRMDSFEYYLWMNAIIKENINVIKYFINKGINVNEVRGRDHPALLLAVSKGYKSIVKLLLDHGAEIDSCTDNTKDTALHLAIERNYSDADISKLLLEYGANKNATNIEGKTPLILAIQKNFLEAVNLLIPTKDYKEFVLSLLYDQKYRKARSSEYILKKSKSIALSRNLNINARDHDGSTALMYAINCGSFREDETLLKLVEFLLDNGADPNLSDRYGITPLMLAVAGNYPRISQLLLNYKADVNAKNRDNTTALFYAEGNEEITQILKIAKGNNDNPQQKILRYSNASAI